MEQEKLERKVREIFERQNFELKDGMAVKPEVSLTLGIYSSEKHTEKDIDYSKDKIFVDEGLDADEDQVYVIEREKEYDLPSFEIIGEIALINDLVGRSRGDVIEGILAHHDVKTILLKSKKLSGEFRVAEYEKLYGDETETIHKEHGKKIKVDPTKAYYSERFSTERKRILKQINQDESVLVMFAGVGPFAMLAAEKTSNVVAVEKNPEACKYLKQNISLNNFEDRIKPVCGDVDKIVPGLEQEFDRVVMPLPGSAIEFLDIAFRSLKPGGVVHLYSFVEEEDFGHIEESIYKVAEREGISADILGKVRCGVKSPSEDRYCFDIEKSS